MKEGIDAGEAVGGLGRVSLGSVREETGMIKNEGVGSSVLSSVGVGSVVVLDISWIKGR